MIESKKKKYINITKKAEHLLIDFYITVRKLNGSHLIEGNKNNCLV